MASTATPMDTGDNSTTKPETAEAKKEGEAAPVSGLYTVKKKKPLFKRRTPKKEEEEEVSSSGSSQTAAHIRIQRDIAELELPGIVQLKRDPDEWMNFSIVIKPNMGYWKGGLYEFEFKIPSKYPFDGPKVQCIDKIYHPNIDLEGKICVNVLRPWKPTYSIQIVLFGLLFLFSHPNPQDPLNNEAAERMRNDLKDFGAQATKAMKGGFVAGTSFTKNRGLL